MPVEFPATNGTSLTHLVLVRFHCCSKTTLEWGVYLMAYMSPITVHHWENSRQKLKQVRNLETGTDTETLEEWCLLTFLKCLPKLFFINKKFSESEFGIKNLIDQESSGGTNNWPSLSTLPRSKWPVNFSKPFPTLSYAYHIISWVLQNLYG